MALPTPSPTPVIDVVVLPSGHQPPIDGRLPEPGEAGDIPSAICFPAIQAYVPPTYCRRPVPNRRGAFKYPPSALIIPIVQGDDWEQLKKGVGQHVGSAQPGEDGNLGAWRLTMIFMAKFSAISISLTVWR